MKFLSQFLKFDLDSFLRDKTLMAVEVKEWKDYDSGDHLGHKLEALITQDNTPYRQKDGEHTTNRFEKLTIKVPKDINVPPDTYIVPVNATATVYGEYRNMLSITAEDIKILQPKQPKKGA